MKTFMKSLESVISELTCLSILYAIFFRSRKDEIDLEIFDMLISFTDFLSFKEMFISYRKVCAMMW